MDKDLELYLAKAKAADESIGSFTEVIGNVPTPWEKGDVITFPKTVKGNAFKTKIGNKKYEYIVVSVRVQTVQSVSLTSSQASSVVVLVAAIGML